jgi:beta-lactamase superfamily II metal-dependent hydrolase
MPALEAALAEAGKDAPDFILCTHYDDDHIGGLPLIVKKYKTGIKKVWMHQTSIKIDPQILTGKAQLKTKSRGIFPSQSGKYLKASSYQEFSYYQKVIKNLHQEVKFIDLLRTLEIPIDEPVTGNFEITGWPELKIISPSQQLYESLFPAKFNAAGLIKSEADGLMDAVTGYLSNPEAKDPNEMLDSLPKSKLTPTNVNSAMLLLTAGDKKFLFAADAGVRSMESIPDYENVLKEIYWLKVPHHGSKNNINSKLIALMKPKIAVISGNGHVSAEVFNCLKYYGSEVTITSENGHFEVDEVCD